MSVATERLGAAASALANLAPDPHPAEMLILGMPAAHRMKLDAEAICSLRQVLDA